MTVLLLALETALAPFAGLGVVLSFLFSRRRGVLAALASELPERCGFLGDEGRVKLMGREVWWLHAASAGEVGGLAPLIKALDSRPNPPAILVTATTAAGRAAARRNPRVAWAQLAPLDAWPCVARFLSDAKPSRLVLTETELWPTTLILAARAGLRPTLINARMTERSLPRYRAAACLLAPALRSLSAVLAQSEADASRFRTVGLPAGRVRVTGNTKYDRATAAADGGPVAAALSRMGWNGTRLFVAGSTHPVEEEMILQAFATVSREVPAARLVLAPRHAERAAETWTKTLEADPNAARWTALDSARPGPKILLVDAMGVLPAFWPRAVAAFVGGTMVPVGGHNLLEPAAAGVPVLFGPHTRSIEHPAQLLAASGGVRVADAAGLADALLPLLSDPVRARFLGEKALRVAEELSGATRRTLAALEMIK